MRREARLDPVRWRRPGRSTLLRWAVVAALVTTAALVMWAGPQSCAPPCRSGPGSAAARSPGAAGPTDHPPAGGVDAGSAAAGTSGTDPGRDSGPSAAGDGASVAGADVPPALAEGVARVAVPPGAVGVPIRLAEPTALQLIHPGDHVDVFRLPDPGERPQAIATAALVVGVTGADPTAGGLLVALRPVEARRAVTAPAGGYAVLLRPDG
jgi:hypothetical protein